MIQIFCHGCRNMISTEKACQHMHITLPSISFFRYCVSSPLPLIKLLQLREKNKISSAFLQFLLHSASRSRSSACLGVRGLGQAANITQCEWSQEYTKKGLFLYQFVILLRMLFKSRNFKVKLFLVQCGFVPFFRSAIIHIIILKAKASKYLLYIQS